ncbi:hypothetical protein [Thioclava sp.]|uniref:hypothetical protein n=1 Tax=Thioclava sp. TaxID=1933450 RepID=UPI003AA9A002
MKKTLALLAASTAFSAPFVVPAWSATPTPVGNVTSAVFSRTTNADRNELPLVFVSDDDERGWSRLFGRDDDEDDDDDDEDDDDEDDDDDYKGGARNPAPAGSVAPPKNGLFGTGAPPQVQVK